MDPPDPKSLIDPEGNHLDPRGYEHHLGDVVINEEVKVSIRKPVHNGESVTIESVLFISPPLTHFPSRS